MDRLTADRRRKWLGDLAVHLFSPAYGEPPLELPERDRHEPLGFVE
jgi:hypothetical protein